MSMNRAEDYIREALREVSALMAEKFAGDIPIAANSSLDQAGLADGEKIVVDYLSHGEAGVAYEHLLYMIDEPPLQISERCYRLIELAGQSLGFSPNAWRPLRSTSNSQFDTDASRRST
jgi:hypothetical protein